MLEQFNHPSLIATVKMDQEVAQRRKGLSLTFEPREQTKEIQLHVYLAASVLLGGSRVRKQGLT